MRKKLFLIDGHAFVFRAFYAIPNLSNSKGEPTNAVYGFWTMIQKILEKEKPDALVVCFDKGEPTFRHERYEGYKADRPEMHEDLQKQLPIIRELLDAHRIPVYEKAGFEADDLLGTLAKKGEESGFDVFIATSDKDAMQLVDKHVKIYHAHKDGAVLGEAEVKEKFSGLGPKDVVEVMSLMGDASDSIPGVPGVGEKTAVKLITEFHSLERLYKHLDEIKSEKLRESLQKNEKEARLSHELATIDCKVPIEFSEKSVLLRAPDETKAQALFNRLEFHSFLKPGTSLERKEASKKDEIARKYSIIRDRESLEKLVLRIQKKKLVSVDTETTSIDPFQAKLVGVSLSLEEGEAFFIPLKHHSGEVMAWKDFEKILVPLLEDHKILKCGQNIKYDLLVFEEAGISLKGIHFDTMIASYLLNPVKRSHNLDDISRERLGVFKIPTSDLLGSGKQEITMDQVPLEKLAEYACEDADCVLRLYSVFLSELKERKLEQLFFDLEMPLVDVLARMEKNGVAIDIPFLRSLSKKAEKELERLTGEIEKIAGTTFNINSPKQLQEILFTKLKLPLGKKGKTGYSTDVSVLEKLAKEHPIAEYLLEYRENQKLKSTYLDALPEMLNSQDHLIHTSFNQTVTATGRLSSSDPNMQNIPIKSELGREIRKGFVPRHQHSKIVSADYSQIELRILAHFSGDEALAKAFHDDRDVHSYTATLLYGVKEKDVTREMRNLAKTINFSIIYGKTAFGLSRDLGIPPGEASAFIGNYFSRYKKVKDYLESQKEKARKDGSLTTILGRQSFFPDINSRNVMARQFAERAAINAPLQGSAADLIKKAMIDVQGALNHRSLKTLMILQVHDELVFDAPASEIDMVTRLVKEKMEHALKLKVPLKVDVTVGESWFKE